MLAEVRGFEPVDSWNDIIQDMDFFCEVIRVAPNKKSIRPEQLIEKCNKLYPKIRKVFLWSDSIVVLHWFKGSAHNWKPFVANRVTEIQGHTDPLDWRHYDEKINPADLITRGCHAEELLNSTKWFYGPLFLSLPEGKWLINKLPSSKVVEGQNERRSKTEVSLHCATQKNKNGREPLLKFEDNSSRERLRRLTDSNDFAEMSGKVKKIMILENSKEWTIPGKGKAAKCKSRLDPQASVYPSNHLLVKRITYDDREKVFHSGLLATLPQIREKYCKVVNLMKSALSR
ncbi:integrase catalytic domain-containing protein [Nephila pilipes]|uniref:Integrase catalytic domain-containing protein n=1 Tax=Nephila pilipes TaxID=299642 RepID=A0A8X6TN58_NEPPI|nr:integrase catalytic domain-containing protein [Nephila pilipes]